MRFTIRQGARLPALAIRLRQTNAAVSLVGATGAFRMETSAGEAVSLAGAVAITNAAEGLAEFQWGEGDTDVSGDYRGEFVFDYGTGEAPDKLTVPIEDSLTVRVLDSLEPDETTTTAEV